MEPLKEMFNKKFYVDYAKVFAKAYSNFDAPAFVKDVSRDLDTMELNARLRNTSVTLKKYLPADFTKATEILFTAAPMLRTGYTALVLPDFIALYGKDHFELSMEALKYFTSFGSSEFAIREFLKTDLKKTLNVMYGWAGDKSVHVRRLASEGSRPRLPWSFRLDAIIKDPKLTTPILEKLKADEELYVRKSVANHLNDISKDNTAYMIQLVKSWDHSNPNTKWIIKHASRNLIKQGHSDSLAIFSFEKNVKVSVDKFRLNKSAIQLGEELQFDFTVTSKKSTPQKLVIDYAVHYPKSSGALSRKIFKLKEITLLPGESKQFSKKQLFKDLTTRKHYQGKHSIEVLVNGKVLAGRDFKLRV